jgi:geranylgeranyl pyrophosphate synthase
MTDGVRDCYDARAEEYTALALGDLDRVPTDRAWLAEFAEQVISRRILDTWLYKHVLWKYA